jgi:hypothetical protein
MACLRCSRKSEIVYGKGGACVHAVTPFSLTQFESINDSRHTTATSFLFFRQNDANNEKECNLASIKTKDDERQEGSYQPIKRSMRVSYRTY